MNIIRSKYFYINVALCGITAVLFVWNIALSNTLVSSRHGNDLKIAELNRLRSELALRESSLGGGNDVANLLSLVKRNGMV